jgi:outer membrane protein, multidrug efflux system
MSSRLAWSSVIAWRSSRLPGRAARCNRRRPAADLQRDTLPHTALPAAWKAGGESAAPRPDAGWRPSTTRLSALVAEALRYNADLQVASALRVEQASGALQVASAPMLPSLGVAGTYSGKSGGAAGSTACSSTPRWSSMCGAACATARRRRSRSPRRPRPTSPMRASRWRRWSPSSWFLAIEAGLQRALVEDALRAALELQRVAQERLRVGVGNEQAVAEAAANVGGVRDTLRQTVQSRDEALRALELLLGRYPAAEIDVAQRLTPMPAPVPIGLPSDLLERRPDVIGAERRVAAAFNRVGEAKAAQLPRISLTAGVSWISSDVLVLQDRSNPGYGFGANLFAPLYQGGALQAQVEIRDAEQKQAMAEYAAPDAGAEPRRRRTWHRRFRRRAGRETKEMTVDQGLRA